MSKAEPPIYTPQRLGRKEQQEQTRDRLIDAAARVFARRGYHGAKLEEIAAEAGFSTGAVYSNFAGKQELFLALADREVAARIADVEAVVDAAEGTGGIEAELERRFQAFIKTDSAWPLLFFEFRALGARDPSIADELDRRRRRVWEVMAKALETVAERNGLRLRHPAVRLAASISAAINGMAFERAMNPQSIPDEVFAAAVSGLVTAAFEPRQEG